MNLLMDSLELLKSTNKADEYENINLEEESGINFLRENAQIIVDDCLDLLSNLDKSISIKDKVTQLEVLNGTLQVLLDELAEEDLDFDPIIEKIENTYNRLMQENEEIAQLAEDSINAYSSSIDEEETLEDNLITGDDVSYSQRNRVSKNILVAGQDEYKSIKINLIAKESEVIENKSTSEPIVKNPNSLSRITTNDYRDEDNLTKSIYSPSFTTLEKGRIKAEITDWNNYISNEEIISMLGSDFSLRNFTRHYQNKTQAIEEESVDMFERWLGETRANVYDYLKDMTLEEINALISDADLKLILKSNNLKYETFLRWIEEYKEIENFIKLNKEALFGELMCLCVAIELAEKQN